MSPRNIAMFETFLFVTTRGKRVLLVSSREKPEIL